jgi:hypothetical protein
VETFLAAVLDEVLVGANTGGLESLRAQLLILVGDEVDAEREVVDIGTLAAKIEDLDLGVGYTTVEPRLGERLENDMLATCSLDVLARVAIFPAAKERFCDAWLPPKLPIHYAGCNRKKKKSQNLPASQFRSQVENIGNDVLKSKVESYLVLAVSVATSRTTSHLVGFCWYCPKVGDVFWARWSVGGESRDDCLCSRDTHHFDFKAPSWSAGMVQLA